MSYILILDVVLWNEVSTTTFKPVS